MTKNVPNSCIYPYLRVLMILLLGIIPVLTPVSAVIFTEDGTNLTAIELYTMTNSTRTGEATSPVVLFTDPNCGSCSHVHEYMETYLKEHPDVSVEIANLSAGPENEDRVNSIKKANSRPGGSGITERSPRVRLYRMMSSVIVIIMISRKKHSNRWLPNRILIKIQNS